MVSKGTKDLSKVTQEGVRVVLEGGPRRIEVWPRRIEGVTIDGVEKRSPWNSREVLAVDVYCESLRKVAMMW